MANKEKLLKALSNTIGSKRVFPGVPIDEDSKPYHGSYPFIVKMGKQNYIAFTLKGLLLPKIFDDVVEISLKEAAELWPLIYGDDHKPMRPSKDVKPIGTHIVSEGGEPPKCSKQ